MKHAPSNGLISGKITYFWSLQHREVLMRKSRRQDQRVEDCSIDGIFLPLIPLVKMSQRLQG